LPSATAEAAATIVEAPIAAGEATSLPAPAGTAFEIESALCPWCSATMTVGATTCPECRATVDPGLVADRVPIPGLTEVPPELQAYSARVERKLKRKSLLSLIFGGAPSPVPPVYTSVEPSSKEALRAPTPEVRAEMARIEREIAGIAEPGEPEQPAAAEAPPGEVPPAEATPGEAPVRKSRTRRPRA
jgi:hypothetical protein